MVFQNNAPNNTDNWDPLKMTAGSPHTVRVTVDEIGRHSEDEFHLSENTLLKYFVYIVRSIHVYLSFN